MYTKKMSDAFHAIKAPENFGVKIFDAENFITILVAPEQLLKLNKDEVKDAITYVEKIKKVFEKHGAIVHIVRPPLEKDKK
jgi:hypothetical protein